MSDPIWALVIIAGIAYAFHAINKRLPGYYQRYLSSARWRRRRRWCLRLGVGLCRACQRMPAHQAHHASYRFLGSITPLELIDLVPLCVKCHRGIHGLHKRRRRLNRRASLRTATTDYIKARRRGIERLAA